MDVGDIASIGAVVVAVVTTVLSTIVSVRSLKLAAVSAEAAKEAVAISAQSAEVSTRQYELSRVQKNQADEPIFDFSPMHNDSDWFVRIKVRRGPQRFEATFVVASNYTCTGDDETTRQRSHTLPSVDYWGSMEYDVPLLVPVGVESGTAGVQVTSKEIDGLDNEQSRSWEMSTVFAWRQGELATSPVPLLDE